MGRGLRIGWIEKELKQFWRCRQGYESGLRGEELRRLHASKPSGVEKGEERFVQTGWGWERDGEGSCKPVDRQTEQVKDG